MTNKVTREQQNEMLREKIVDLADFWDGKESLKYGMKLTKILKELGINDIPKCYTQEYYDRIISTMSGTSTNVTIKEKNKNGN